MTGYLIRRLGLAIPTLLLVAIAVFGMVRLAPGDPAQVLLGESASPAEIDAKRAQMGLDEPMPAQFLRWAGDVANGDLGTSLLSGQPVTNLVLDRFAVSAPIVVAAVALALIIAVIGGLYAALNRGRTIDIMIVTTATILLSIPAFWLGLMFMLFFGLKLGWAPVIGFVPFSEDPVAALSYMVLPVIVLALAELGVLTRMMRASAIEVLGLDYVLHARAKGLDNDRVLGRHVFPNAFAPTLTLTGLLLANLLGGIAVIETVFTLPGLGRLMVDAVLARDYPVIQGCLLFTAGIYILVNLSVDLIYPLFDPKIVNA
ncbi:ABC transporter permease [Sphingorhabdus sp.]|uniref:ABC transporter permease n=1 Tax=Sphingorhabdus sp. TaxID=1902408 RepID=UPI0037C50DD4